MVTLLSAIMMINMNFSVIIPTYKREDDLGDCLESIVCQSLLPNRVFLVDDDELSGEFVFRWKADLSDKGIDLVHYVKDHSFEPRGSNESRNKGLALAIEEIVFIFDDDIILEDGFFEAIIKTWNECDSKNLIGVGGVIKNNRKQGVLENFYAKVFGLAGESDWDVNDVAFQSWNDWIIERKKGYYIHGGVCLYRRSSALDIGGFTIFEGGRGGLVDPDFCLKAKKAGYHFMIEPQAKAIHNHSPSGREGSFLSGWKEGYNRKRIFKDHCEKTLKTRLWFGWANIGWILRQFLTGKFAKGVGMVKGLLTPQK